MKCKIKQEELIAYCYGELKPERADEIKKHALICSQCLSRIKETEKTLLLAQGQKLKEIPGEILHNYNEEVMEKLVLGRERGLLLRLKEKVSLWLENLRLGFYPRLVPAVAIVGMALLVFAFTQYSRINTLNSVNQDIALLETLDEESVGVYLAADDAALSEEIERADAVLLAELDREIESGDVLEDLELLQELDEDSIIDVDEENILEYLDTLDEFAGNPVVG